MPSHLAFACHGIPSPSQDPRHDGSELAKGCIDKVKRDYDVTEFPPQLFILLVSPAFCRDAGALKELLAGVHDETAPLGREVPLIGSSVAAVFYEDEIQGDKIQDHGALLVCLASRLLRARVAVREGATSGDPAVVTRDLLSELGVNMSEERRASDEGPGQRPTAGENGPTQMPGTHSLTDEPSSPLSHWLLLAFLPGSGPIGPEARGLTQHIHDELWHQTNFRIRIVGGVSSINDPEHRKPVFQFAGRRVCRDAVTGALINSDVPTGQSLASGVDWERETFSVRAFSHGGRAIAEFTSGMPDLVLPQKKLVLFKEQTGSSGRVVAMSLPAHAGGWRRVDVLRQFDPESQLVMGRPSANKMLRTAKQGIERSRGMRIWNPAGCFSIKCASHFRNRELLKLDIESGIRQVREEQLNGRPYVGGFFDGEIGTDESGKSIYANWCVATAIFGDELSDRGLKQRTYSSMRHHGAELSSTTDLNKAIETSLQLIYDIGYPGAVISLLLPDDHKKQLVETMEKGFRFHKAKGLVPIELAKRAILLRIEREHRPYFISDSREDPYCYKLAVRESGVISQCIICLRDPEGASIGFLQIDLGDATYKTQPDFDDSEEASMLGWVGAFIAANLNRIFSWRENEIIRKLDDALRTSLSVAILEMGLQSFIREAAKAFDLEMGQIRLSNQEGTALDLVAGVGRYYDAAKVGRAGINLSEEGDLAPVTAFNDPRNTPIVVNDAGDDPSHRKLVERYPAKGYPEVAGALQTVRSYANVSFRRLDEGQTGAEKGSVNENAVGTVSLMSTEGRFFKSYHPRVLKALADRVGLLVDHLTQKQNETLLSKATPELSKIDNFHQIGQVLKKATSDFCLAVGADWGALYLREADFSLYVVRAEYRWESGDEWVDRAFYKSNECWIGNEVTRFPRYFPDLEREYDKPEYKTKYDRGAKRYAREAFGQELSGAFAVEALALPFEVGGESLGILTIYRRKCGPNASRSKGFSTTDLGLLARAADPFAGLLKLVWSHQDTIWDNLGRDLRERLHEVVAPQEGTDFEVRVSRELLTLLKAARVDFYRSSESSSPNWLIGYALNRTGGAHRTQTAPPPDDAVDSCAEQKKLRREKIETVKETELDEDERIFKGVVTRATIPLISPTDELVGVLDVFWNADIKQVPPLTGKRGLDHLCSVGRIVGSAYQGYNLANQNDENRGALEIISSGTRARTHSLLTPMRRLGKLFEEFALKGRSFDKTSEVIKHAQHLYNTLNENLKAVDLVTGSSRRLVDPSYVVKNALKEVGDPDYNIVPRPDEVSLPEGLLVVCIEKQLEEVFVNLLNNSRQAMEQNGNSQRITVAGDVESGRIRILLKDAGGGMPDPYSSFVREFRKDRKIPRGRDGEPRLGLYLSLVLLEMMNGDLSYTNYETEMEKGGTRERVAGTITTVTLPLRSPEEVVRR
jgi:signal transduction histidine kinase